MRKLKRFFAAALAAALCLSTAACKPKTEPMPMDAVTAEVETPYIVEVDKSITKTITLPVEGAAAVVSDVSPGIEASYTAPDLTVKGLAVGDNALTITFSAKGYDDGVLALNVTVSEPPPPPPPQLEVALSSELLGINSGIPAAGPIVFNMESGVGAQITVHPAVTGDLVVTAESSGPSLDIVTDGRVITLNPREAGAVTLTITAAQQGYTSAVAQCNIQVKPPHTKLELTGKAKLPLQVSKGQSTTVPITHDGELSFSVSPEIAAAQLEGGRLTLTGTAEGDGLLTLTAVQEGHQDSELALAFTVTAPAPPPEPPSPYQDVIDGIIKYTNLRRADAGLAALKTSAALSKAAAIRAQETAVDQSHTRPDGRRGLTAIQDAGLGEHTAEGENLAGGEDAETGAEVVQRWMDSPAHRDAILLPEFTTIGIGVYYDGNIYRYCQLFTGSKL